MPIDHDAIDRVRPLMREKLRAIEAEHGVEILFAVESGSRAWGFASPDSDFDCRFVYRHPRDWYVSVEEQRDVIEEAIDENDLDVAGWDLRKALRLMLKSNPVLDEWLTSPIIWFERAGMRQAFRDLFLNIYDLEAFRHHHAHMARSAIHRHLGGEQVKLKRYFYVLRPLMALEWMSIHHAMPPMAFDQLIEESVLPPAVRQAIDDLILLKTTTPELGLGDHIAILDEWIHSAHEHAFLTSPKRPRNAPYDADKRAHVDAFYRAMIGV